MEAYMATDRTVARSAFFLIFALESDANIPFLVFHCLRLIDGRKVSLVVWTGFLAISHLYVCMLNE
jgi:hypothetical protein